MAHTTEGFSLADVLVAIAILVTTALLLWVFVYAQTLRRSVNYQAIAARIATDQLEELKNTSWDNLVSSGTLSNASLNRLPTGAGSFIVSAPTSSGALRQAQVRVQWRDRGLDKIYTQTTYLSPNGI